MDFRDTFYKKYLSEFKSDGNVSYSGESISSRRFAEVKYLTHLKSLGKEEPILDIACGSGHLLQILRDSGYENLIGIDISEEQVSAAKNRGVNVEVAEALEFLPRYENAFSVIFAIDLLEHFTKSELLSFMEFVYKSLKPNGIFIARTPNGQGIFSGQIMYGDITHMTILTPNSYRQLARIVGFSDIQCNESSPVAGNIRGWVRFILWESLKFLFYLCKKIESGKSQWIWTENMILISRK